MSRDTKCSLIHFGMRFCQLYRPRDSARAKDNGKLNNVFLGKQIKFCEKKKLHFFAHINVEGIPYLFGLAQKEHVFVNI